MTAKQVIHEMAELSPVEQAEVIRHAYRLDAERQLSGAELTALARRMVAAEYPAEQARIRAEIARGFYGGKSNA
jgi:RNA polymerase-interacting CarD/CdnL/TRCF family regulator